MPKISKEDREILIFDWNNTHYGVLGDFLATLHRLKYRDATLAIQNPSTFVRMWYAGIRTALASRTASSTGDK